MARQKPVVNEPLVASGVSGKKETIAQKSVREWHEKKKVKVAKPK